MRNPLLLWIGFLLFHLAGTWSVPLIDRDEPRFAEASREMRERGDYVVPYFNNRYRFDKPPLTYWMQTASYRVFGENDFGARFPTALAAALASLCIFAWGSRINSADAGFCAATIFATSLQVFVIAKAATADMWLVLFVTIALWCGWELIERRGRSRLALWLAFTGALALGFLAKGPVALLPVIVVACAIPFGANATARMLGSLALALLGSIAVVALWGVPALHRTDGEFWRVGIGRHVVERSFATMEGHGASSIGMYFLLLPFYFITVFASLFPWSIKLPALCRQLWSRRDSTDNYLILGTAILFLVFTLVRTKLPHYTLPAFPLLALLLARNIQVGRFFRPVAIAAAALYLLIALVLAPMTGRLFVSRALFDAAKAELLPEMEFASVGYSEPSLVWYFRDRIRGFMADPPVKERNVKAYMEKPGARFIILPTALAQSLYPELPAGWKAFASRGLNVAKGKTIELTLLLKTI